VPDGARRQPTGPAVAATFAEQLGVQVGEVDWLEGFELQPADGRQRM
jgi:hypothetical protein